MSLSEYATENASFTDLAPTSREQHDILGLASLLSEEANSNGFFDTAGLSPGPDQSPVHSFLERTLSTDDPRHFFPARHSPGRGENRMAYVKPEPDAYTGMPCPVDDVAMCLSGPGEDLMADEFYRQAVATTAAMCYPTLPQVKSLTTPIKSLPFSPSQVIFLNFFLLIYIFYDFQVLIFFSSIFDLKNKPTEFFSNFFKFDCNFYLV